MNGGRSLRGVKAIRAVIGNRGAQGNGGEEYQERGQRSMGKGKKGNRFPARCKNAVFRRLTQNGEEKEEGEENGDLKEEE